MATIPHGNVISDTWEESTLSDTQEDAGCYEATEVLNETHADHDNSPCKHDDSEPDGWAEALHGHVGWNLGSDVEWEENSEGDIVVQVLHFEILLKRIETSISDVCAVKERKTVGMLDGYVLVSCFKRTYR